MEPLTLFTARAGLVAFGLRFQQGKVWAVIQHQLQTKQKVREHQPLDKLMDCFINILAGGKGLLEINFLVRPDVAVQWAFGRQTCAEQSTISDTLNACTPENVQQLREALQIILRQASQSYHHDYAAAWQVFDIDTTGLPAGRLGEGVTKGYFAGRKSCRGRQLGRVVATLYDEIIVDQLYEGKRQLESSLSQLVAMTEQALNLGQNQRARTVLRVDVGGGSETNINWILNHDYLDNVRLATGCNSPDGRFCVNSERMTLLLQLPTCSILIAGVCPTRPWHVWATTCINFGNAIARAFGLAPAIPASKRMCSCAGS